MRIVLICHGESFFDLKQACKLFKFIQAGNMIILTVDFTNSDFVLILLLKLLYCSVRLNCCINVIAILTKYPAL